jgi:hypothetical protein
LIGLRHVDGRFPNGARAQPWRHQRRALGVARACAPVLATPICAAPLRARSLTAGPSPSPVIVVVGWQGEHLLHVLNTLGSRKVVLEAELREIENDIAANANMCRKYGDDFFTEGTARLAQTRAEKSQKLAEIDAQLADTNSSVRQGKQLLGALAENYGNMAPVRLLLACARACARLLRTAAFAAPPFLLPGIDPDGRCGSNRVMSSPRTSTRRRRPSPP